MAPFAKKNPNNGIEVLARLEVLLYRLPTTTAERKDTNKVRLGITTLAFVP